jgi:hypothetical protein
MHQQQENQNKGQNARSMNEVDQCNTMTWSSDRDGAGGEARSVAGEGEGDGIGVVFKRGTWKTDLDAPEIEKPCKQSATDVPPEVERENGNEKTGNVNWTSSEHGVQNFPSVGLQDFPSVGAEKDDDDERKDAKTEKIVEVP